MGLSLERSLGLEVVDVQRPIKGLTAQICSNHGSGSVAVDDIVTTIVDAEYRRRASSSTLRDAPPFTLHSVKRSGTTHHQAGSYNKAGYMRFDFSVESGFVGSNAFRRYRRTSPTMRSRTTPDVVTRIMSLDEAKESGAMALFGEKYGETSARGRYRRTVVSRVMCWHSRVAIERSRTHQPDWRIQYWVSCNRRVEALVGASAFDSFAGERALVAELTFTARSPGRRICRRELPELVERLEERGSRTIAQYQAAAVRERVPALVSAGNENSTRRNPLLSGWTVGLDRRTTPIGHGPPRSAWLGSGQQLHSVPKSTEGPPSSLRDDRQRRGLRVSPLGRLPDARQRVLGGGGGGREDVAQGGGADPSLISSASRRHSSSRLKAESQCDRAPELALMSARPASVWPVVTRSA